jgi:hypothetical protein
LTLAPTTVPKPDTPFSKPDRSIFDGGVLEGVVVLVVVVDEDMLDGDPDGASFVPSGSAFELDLEVLDDVSVAERYVDFDDFAPGLGGI